MRRTIVFGAAWALLAALSASAPAQDTSWVDQILPERAFDLGTVARGSKVRHTFKLVNRLDRPVHIADWKAKCGCTDVRVGARDIPPGTQTTIEAVIDTTKFVGYKPSGLTLTLDQPSPVSVDLNLSCFIRGDITLNPGVADFGALTRSAESKPTMTLNLAYAGGQPNWGITEMKTRSSKVAAKLQEVSRSASGVQYQLTATLEPGDTTGYFKDEITLVTNDPSSPRIPVSVTANVQAAVTVSPSPLVLGQLKPGQEVTQTLLVRSSQPFKLTSMKPSREDVTATPDSDQARPVHTVKVTFKAPGGSGPYHAVVEIATDVKDEPPAKLSAFATVVP